MKNLIKVVETYRIDTEAEVEEFIKSLKNDSRFELSNYKTDNKVLKVKGEIEDTWKRVTVTKIFNEEKAPNIEVDVDYNLLGFITTDKDDDIDPEEAFDMELEEME